MSGYQCANPGCAATGTSSGSHCGQPMTERADRDRSATVDPKLRAVRETRVLIRRGKR